MIGLQTQQVLLPKKVYIGDSAELRCTFNSNSLSLKNFAGEGSVQLSKNVFQGELDFQNYSIQKIQISPAGVDYYQLSITFVPWKTGNLQFPAYDIAANFAKDDAIGQSDDNLIVNFDSVNVVSLVEQTSAVGLRGFSAPLLLPGTTYKLYGCCLGIILFLIILIRTVIKRRELIFYLKNKKLMRFYKKNRRATERRLRKLMVLKKGKQPVTDKEFCENFQGIMRNYLEIRFNQPFTRCATSQMMQKIYSAFGGTEDFSSLISETKENAATELISSFIRTDYVRYSSNGAFAEDERSDMVSTAMRTIAIFEGDINEGGETDV